MNIIFVINYTCILYSKVPWKHQEPIPTTEQNRYTIFNISRIWYYRTKTRNMGQSPTWGRPTP